MPAEIVEHFVGGKVWERAPRPFKPSKARQLPAPYTTSSRKELPQAKRMPVGDNVFIMLFKIAREAVVPVAIGYKI